VAADSLGRRGHDAVRRAAPDPVHTRSGRAFPRTERLDVWCAENGVEEAVVAGFFLRDPYRPLGELWSDGRPIPHEPVVAPFGRRRGSVVIDPGAAARLIERQAAPARPTGDLVQAGPLLVADGEIVFDAGVDREGFSAGAGQFDSDITAGRYPRAALGISEQWLMAVACDGRRSSVDGGLDARACGGDGRARRHERAQP
jgi:Phosphodiester glycosidase